MLRDRRLRETELRDEVSDRTALDPQEIENATTTRLGHDLERRQHAITLPTRHMPVKAYVYLPTAPSEKPRGTAEPCRFPSPFFPFALALCSTKAMRSRCLQALALHDLAALRWRKR